MVCQRSGGGALLVKSHQEVRALVTESDVRKIGKILADAQATEAVDRSARG